MRLALLQKGEHDYYFLWSHHQILLDGWSVSLVLSDFFDLYRAISHGDNSHAPRRRPYRDYIGWLETESRRGREVWRHLLRGFSEPTRLGLERQGAATAGSPPQSHHEQFEHDGTSTRIKHRYC